MANKIALITGASRGIGAATARLFAAEGYDICLNYLHSTDKASELAREIRNFGVRVIAVQADVSVEAEAQRLFETMDSELGTLNVLVNNVGKLQQQTRMVDISLDRFNHIVQTNLISCFLCCREAVKRMSSANGGAGGAIVNVSSGAAKSGSPNEYVDYAAAKGAVDTLTRGLALEVAQEGIRVNGIRPGLIYTDMHADGGEPGRVDRLAKRIPLQRGGQADEIAQGIYFLASDASSFTTGTLLDMAGGL